MTATTGPKTSSRQTRSCVPLGRTTVGGYHQPAPSGAEPRKATSTGACPPDSASSTKPRTAFRWPDETSGPIWVASSPGSPTTTSLSDALEALHERVEHAALHQDPAARAAVLTGVVEEAHRRGGRRGVEVGVGEDDVGRLAAELQRHPLELVRRLAHDALADRGRPREADLADVGVGDEPLPHDRPLAGQDREHPFRDAGVAAPAPRSGLAVSGVSSAGLRTTVLPAASAGARPQPAMGIGKFQGTMTETQPSGSLKVTSSPPATGICRPKSRSGAAE